jgi:hypothetical protein
MNQRSKHNKVDRTTLIEWKKVCDAASPGPWEPDIDDPETEMENWTGKFSISGPVSTWCTYSDEHTESVNCANARFIALARTALIDLLLKPEKEQYIPRSEIAPVPPLQTD